MPSRENGRELRLVVGRQRRPVAGLARRLHLLVLRRGPLLAAERPWTEFVHVLLRLHVRNDRHRRERIHVGAVPEVVIVMEVRVEHERHRLVGPLPDLRDVLLGRGRQEASVHHEHLPVANDHRRVPARRSVMPVPMLNRIDALGQLRDLALGLRAKRLDASRDANRRCQQAPHEVSVARGHGVFSGLGQTVESGRQHSDTRQRQGDS